MTTLVSDIIRDAYRESNLISIGTEPSGAQRQEAMRFINRLVPSVLGFEGGESLETFYLDGSQEIDIGNTRLVLADGMPTTIYLPPVTEDGLRFAVTDPQGLLAATPLTLVGAYNTIEGQKSVTLGQAGTAQEYFFRADIGNWQKVSTLVETDPWPFPIEFDDMFVVTLAFRLNPRYNIASQQESLMMLKRSERQFRARYKQAKEMPSDVSILRLDSDYNYSGFDKGTF